ncbi:hypothetical protein [Deinococcus sedimenti]|uniref:Uncharacterized protein n=1 Tax=Deinococcus sedimenti TaxID=1867090 RepID=A0ABQ2S5W6_9DEIO|nr:hypothetical protein [Deinococcus sedimenti]GGS00786.1 hypothetical protein GCM10008960_29400 [Deinococcus sedimenti]
MQTTKPRNITRTWNTTTEHRPYGEHWGDTLNTVTLTADQHGNQTAQVDGQPATVAHAVSILNRAARVELVSEYRTPTPAPVIGKPRAAQLHRLMGRAGVPSGEHYAFAGAALDRPVFSLAALTEAEARAVWAFLTYTHPHAA